MALLPALLAALALAAGLLTAAPAPAQPAPPAQMLGQTLAAGSTRSSVAIAVADIGEGRLALQFELPLAVTRATLVDPAGTPRVLLPGQDLHVQPAAERREPRRGDQHLLLQPVPDPAPGRWQLQLEHAAARGGETLHVVVSQFPRFELRLALVGGAQPPGAGSEALLELRISDQGRPATGLQPQATVQAPGVSAQPLRFWDTRPAAVDLPLQPEPGQYFALFAPEAAGRHQVLVQQPLRGRDGVLRTAQRQLDIDVAAQPVLQALRPLVPAGAAGCLPRIGLAVDWPAQQPGRYTLLVVLQGSTGTHTLRGGADAAAAGPLQLQVALGAREAAALGSGVRATRVDLLHVGGSAYTLLQRRRALPFSVPLPLDRLCR
ncbi:hypothetical protein ACPOLB_11115 [Rubrivivax sp. RP6-9]|uniref:hypothetical protein n=1 Tax=Rubrivivax sp. RP6-9 TaxID=3415750 RepID=UPI003CC532AB